MKKTSDDNKSGYQNKLTILDEYGRYLYEEEKNKAERFHGAMKTYLIFIGSTIGAVVTALKWLEITPANIKFTPYSSVFLYFIIIALIALVILIISFVYAVLVIKVWKTERLCNPKEFIFKTIAIANEFQIKEEIIANYAIAAERNARVNDQKARLLGIASILYRSAILLLLCDSVLYIFI